MPYIHAAALAVVISCMAAFASGSLRGVPVEAGLSAHQQIVHDGDGFRLESDGDVVRIADLTSYCEGCHTEIGNDANDPTISASVEVHHPVDVPYPGGKPGYVPITDLDPNLRLVEGNLSCITCHDPRAADRALVIGLEDGKLCLACHRN